MDIVGRGFIARNLAEISGRHRSALVLAAGVSSTSVVAQELFDREEKLLDDVITRCQAGRKLLVFLSSASHAMYGRTSVAATESSKPSVDSPYGRHKRRLEAKVTQAGVPWLILRLSHAIGRWQREHQLLPNFVRQVADGKVVLYQDTYRDLMDVTDVVHTIDSLLASGVTGEVINVASSTPRPISDLAEGIAKRMGIVPLYETVEAVPVRTLVSIDKLCALVPEMNAIRDADYLDRTLDRYVSCYWPPAG